MVETVERQETGQRERGNDTQQRPSSSGLETGPTVVRTIASVHGASAYPTAPPTTPENGEFNILMASLLLID